MPDKPLYGSAARCGTYSTFLRWRDGWQASSFGGFSKGSTRTTGSRSRTVGPGVREIRIQIAGAHRVFYVTTRPEAIYVLHAFEKKAQKTSAADLRSGRERLRSLEQLRQRDEKERRS